MPVDPSVLPGLNALTTSLGDKRRSTPVRGVLQELQGNDWAAKLRSAILQRDVVDDAIRVLTTRAANAGQLRGVLEVWDDALERNPKAAIYIGQALPHLCDAALYDSPHLLAEVVKLFGQALSFAHAIDERAPAKKRVEVSRLAHALLAADMAVPRAHRTIVEIVRAHREIISTDPVTWPFLAPLV